MKIIEPNELYKQKSKMSKIGVAFVLLLIFSIFSTFDSSCASPMAEGESTTDGAPTTDGEANTDGAPNTDGENLTDSQNPADGEKTDPEMTPVELTALEITPPDTSAPSVISTMPSHLETGVALSSSLTITFSEEMDPSTINITTFKVLQGSTTVDGAMTYSGVTATFKPTNPLLANETYTASISTDAKGTSGMALKTRHEWSFKTSADTAMGPAPVNLGMAGDFVILAKAGIDTIPTSAITGNIGASPIDAAGITGFSLIADATNVFSTSTQVTGKVYAANYAVPTPANLTKAISDMETAYADAAGRTTPDFKDVGAGDISGLTLVPGLYKWGTGLKIASNVTLKGGANDVWIFQIAGSLTQAAGTRVILDGNARAKNVFWQVFGVTALDTTAHIEGIILSLTKITMATSASINGRLYSQTAVTLQACQVTQPAP